MRAKKNNSLTVRLTKGERDYLEKESEKRGVSKSQLLRRIIYDAHLVEHYLYFGQRVEIMTNKING